LIFLARFFPSMNEQGGYRICSYDERKDKHLSLFDITPEMITEGKL